jgi:hypothetical protein
MKRIFIAGEGKTELGSWDHEPPYQDDSEPGVLKAFLQKVRNEGWAISAAVKWANIRKFKSGDHRSPEERNVLGACLKAKEKGCSIVAFARDTDCDENRESDIKKGLKAAQEKFGAELSIIGGCAKPCIEGWVLAFSSTLRTETFTTSKACDTLKTMLDGEPHTTRMVECISGSDLSTVANDALSLKEWLETAKTHLKS